MKQWLALAIPACLEVAQDRPDEEVIEDAARFFVSCMGFVQMKATGKAEFGTAVLPGHVPAPGETPGAYRLEAQCLSMEDLAEKLQNGQMQSW